MQLNLHSPPSICKHIRFIHLKDMILSIISMAVSFSWCVACLVQPFRLKQTDLRSSRSLGDLNTDNRLIQTSSVREGQTAPRCMGGEISYVMIRCNSATHHIQAFRHSVLLIKAINVLHAKRAIFHRCFLIFPVFGMHSLVCPNSHIGVSPG